MSLTTQQQQLIDAKVNEIRSVHRIFCWYQNNALKEFLMTEIRGCSDDWFDAVDYVYAEHGIIIGG